MDKKSNNILKNMSLDENLIDSQDDSELQEIV